VYHKIKPDYDSGFKVLLGINFHQQDMAASRTSTVLPEAPLSFVPSVDFEGDKQRLKLPVT
jgi:hypothetical protein